MSEFKRFEQQSNDLFNWQPAWKNLFEVVIYDSNSQSFTKNDVLTKIASLRASAVSFNGDSLNLSRNDVTKKFAVTDEGYKRSDILSITWAEDNLWEVRNLHNEWVDSIYDRNKDQFKSVPIGNPTKPYKDIYIYGPSSSNTSNEASLIMAFYNVLPNNLTSLDLNWSSNELINHKLDYYIESWSTEDLHI